MPTPRANPGAAVADDGRIFVFGGFDGFRSLSTVEAYDPSTNTWITLTRMPTDRRGSGAATGYDGKIYLIGGSQVSPGREVFVPVVEAYDPSTDSWTSVAPLPAARSHFSAVLGMDGRIYAMGGRNSTSGFLHDVTVYDPSDDIWRTLSPLPTGRYNLAAAVAIDGRIYAIGGFDEFYRYANAVEVYDPSNDRWTAAPSLQTGREGLGGVRGTDDRIYAIGGLTFKPNGPVVLTTVEAYTP